MAFITKKTGTQYWNAGWRDDTGKRKNRSTKVAHTPYKAENRRKAQKIADEFEATSKGKRTISHLREVINELSVEITGEAIPTSTVKIYSNTYLKIKEAETSQRTIDAYKSTFRDFCCFLGDRADVDMNDITKSELVNYRLILLERVSETTVQNKMKKVRALFASAKEEGLIRDNPSDGLKMKLKSKDIGSKLKTGKRAFTIDEVKRMMEVANDEWRTMILFGLYTGQRLGDLATITWGNIDMDKGVFTISTQKTGRQIIIPMNQSLIDHLKTLPSPLKQGQYIHPSLANLYTVGGTKQKSSGVLSNQFASVLAEAGLRKPVSHRKKEDGKGRTGRRDTQSLGFHCLRVTAVTLLHEAGVPQAIVEQWVGHDSSDVHRLYIKMGEENLREASDKLPSVS